MTKKEKIETNDWTYVGEVKNGKPHGQGNMIFHSIGKEYIGTFENGTPFGEGTYILSGGEKIKGRYVKGKFKPSSKTILQ